MLRWGESKVSNMICLEVGCYKVGPKSQLLIGAHNSSYRGEITHLLAEMFHLHPEPRFEPPKSHRCSHRASILAFPSKEPAGGGFKITFFKTPILGEMIQIDERDLSNPLVQPPGRQGMSHLTTPSSSKGKWTFFVSPLKFYHILQGGPYQS